jgi:hypothetical protein
MTRGIWKLLGVDTEREDQLIKRLEEKVVEAKNAECSLSRVIEEAKATSRIIAGIQRVRN